MSDRFAAASGRRVVSRASAEELGNLAHVVVDVKRRQVASLVVGEGRNALLVGWEQVSGFGPDAVVIAEESALRPPRDDRERAAADGKLELVGKCALSDMGNDLGTVSDVLFDPATGVIETLVLGDREEPAASLPGAGSFAAVVRAPADRSSRVCAPGSALSGSCFSVRAVRRAPCRELAAGRTRNPLAVGVDLCRPRS